MPRAESEAPMKTTSERRERKDVRRNMERVLEAAHDLFAERGDGVTMEEVARRAGVGVGTIYRRFPSKEHLLAAVSHAACADVQHCLHEAAAEAPDPITRLRALIVIQYRRTRPQAALLEFCPSAGEATIGGAASDQPQIYATLHALLLQVIADGQRQGVVRPGDPATLAALCLELLSPRAFERLSRAIGGEADDVAEHTIDFILHGLGARV